MNTFLIILFIIILIAIVLGIIYINLYNKINESVIRINEAEARIDSSIRDKYDLLQNGVNILKNKYDIKDNVFNDLMKLKSKRISNFEMDRNLIEISNAFLGLCSSNEDINNDEEVYDVIKRITIIDEEMATLRHYYNSNVTNYNLMVKKIPTNIICKILKYKTRLFYDMKDMSDEDNEDFKL